MATVNDDNTTEALPRVTATVEVGGETQVGVGWLCEGFWQAQLVVDCFVNVFLSMEGRLLV